MNFTKKSAPFNILLADDDADDRQFFEKALKGVDVATNLITVHDGEQLMTYLFDHIEKLPTILFLDLSMPRKTGFECLTEIKGSKQLKDLPVVIFTTSFGRDMYFEQGLIKTLSNIGTQQYVKKPADLVQLQHIINSALNTAISKVSKKDEHNIDDDFVQVAETTSKEIS